jgi:hypothetical protein
MVAMRGRWSATRHLTVGVALVALLAYGCAEMPRTPPPTWDPFQPCCERQQVYDLFAAPHRLGR